MKLRFTIRDLFWLVRVVALALGWWLEHRRFARYANIPPEAVIIAEQLKKQNLSIP